MENTDPLDSPDDRIGPNILALCAITEWKMQKIFMFIKRSIIDEESMDITKFDSICDDAFGSFSQLYDWVNRLKDMPDVSEDTES